MLRSRVLLLLLACLAASLSAGEESVGTTSANFLKIPYSARAAGMGEAYTAVSDDEAALVYNPAGAAQMVQSELSATNVEWFQGIDLEHLGDITPVEGIGSLGLGITFLNDGSLVGTKRIANNGSADALGNYITTGTFTPYDLAINLLWAYQPAEHWDVGVGAQIIQEAIDTNSGWGAGLDLGAQRTDLFGWLDAGLEVQNLGTTIEVGSSASSEPVTLAGGLAGRFLKRTLTLAANVAVPMDNSVIPSVGAEWWVAQPLALRLGWMGGYASQPTAGLGFRYESFLLDYAYQPFSELGDTSRFTLSVVFGGPETKLLALRPLLGPIGDPAWREGDFELEPDRPDSVVAWHLDLIGPDGTVRRTWSGDGPAPEKLPWDGKDGQDKVLPDGLYTGRLEVDYPAGLKAKADSTPVELDSTPPSITLDEDPVRVRPDARGELLIPAKLSLGAQDKNGIGGWKLEVTDQAGKPIKIFSGQGQPPAQMDWDGSDDQGGFINSGSNYYFWPFAEDKLGNWGRGQPKALIVLLKEIHFDLASDALFEPGKADVRISAYHQLAALKDMILKQEPAGLTGTAGTTVKVDIVGYTDNTPVVMSVYHDNQSLSLARAQAVAKFLVVLMGMDPSMLNPVGMGEADPKASNDTPEGRETNRRVQVVIHVNAYQ
ncbi:MAG TPA: PorV/PorQ family protein [bacterium]|jgi:outer membrane protein OmpA-like peptidoglycan-associated protein|nr:PorV/PorQ family protein [bacterium]